MDYYAVLGIRMDAGDADIRTAFRALARRYHPDAGEGSSVEKFRQAQEAYETLSDPERRRAYDLTRPRPRGVVEPITATPRWRADEPLDDDPFARFDALFAELERFFGPPFFRR